MRILTNLGNLMSCAYNPVISFPKKIIQAPRRFLGQSLTRLEFIKVAKLADRFVVIIHFCLSAATLVNHFPLWSMLYLIMDNRVSTRYLSDISFYFDDSRFNLSRHILSLLR